MGRHEAGYATIGLVVPLLDQVNALLKSRLPPVIQELVNAVPGFDGIKVVDVLGKDEAQARVCESASILRDVVGDFHQACCAASYGFGGSQKRDDVALLRRQHSTTRLRKAQRRWKAKVFQYASVSNGKHIRVAVDKPREHSLASAVNDIGVGITRR